MADDVLSPARRVATIAEVEQPGDYCGPRPDGGLWFLLPVPIDREGVDGPRSMHGYLDEGNVWRQLPS